MLTLLDRIGAADLAARFVRDFLPLDCDGHEGPVLARLGSGRGWQPLAKPLQHFFAQQAPADELERVIERWDAYDDQHLQTQIKAQRLDLTHVTMRTGSPQTLVCTKNQATYERRRAQFDMDVQLLAELEDIASSKTTRLDVPSAPHRTKPKQVSSAAPPQKSRKRK